MNKPTTYKGVTYPSIIAVARRFGLLPETVKDRLKKGHPLEPRYLRNQKWEAITEQTTSKAS